MTNEEFVDIHVEDLRAKIPKLLGDHPGTIAFLRVFGDLAGLIVDTAAVLDDDAKAYAERRIAGVIIEFGKTPAVKLV